jgi:hypothetical protein
VDRSGPAYNGKRLNGFLEYHPRQWVDRSGPAYNGKRLDGFLEYHPRQWVDRSGTAYKGERGIPVFVSCSRRERREIKNKRRRSALSL